MSWYCRKPRPKNAPVAQPKSTSPYTQKHLDSLKETGPKKTSKKLRESRQT